MILHLETILQLIDSKIDFSCLGLLILRSVVPTGHVPSGLTNQNCQSRLKVGAEHMPDSGSIRHEHVSGLPLVCVVLTVTFALMQVSTISAPVFSPEFFESRPHAFQLSTIPDKSIWPDLTSAIFFSSKQEIDSIGTILTDVLPMSDFRAKGIIRCARIKKKLTIHIPAGVSTFCDISMYTRFVAPNVLLNFCY